MVVMGTRILAPRCTWQNRHATTNQRGPRPLAGFAGLFGPQPSPQECLMLWSPVWFLSGSL
jgi:hypothetical protein